MVETINKLARINREATQDFGRAPTDGELARRMGPGFTAKKINQIRLINIDPSSLDKSIGSEGESFLYDFIEDKRVLNPLDFSRNIEIVETINDILPKYLNEREVDIIRLRQGIDPETGQLRESVSLEELSVKYGVSRERIRQIESKAMKKMKDKASSELLHFKEG